MDATYTQPVDEQKINLGAEFYCRLLCDLALLLLCVFALD